MGTCKYCIMLSKVCLIMFHKLYASHLLKLKIHIQVLIIHIVGHIIKLSLVNNPTGSQVLNLVCAKQNSSTLWKKCFFYYLRVHNLAQQRYQSPGTVSTYCCDPNKLSCLTFSVKWVMQCVTDRLGLHTTNQHYCTVCSLLCQALPLPRAS